ncbi:AbrB/MazE/SpoVT family DNA-binding domain-containing protein [Candidatus Woesearchaeota archaeon]|nr:AbrB/MazE/SpoVT family DNA-binding domain-containing protein [Candidatus Woesearchaeota archaeon]
MKRKLQSNHAYSSFVCLPAKWVKDNNLGPGKSVIIEEVEGGLKIMPFGDDEIEAVNP